MKNTNYTIADVKMILGRIKYYIEKDQYIISQNNNRLKNIGFIKNYGLKSSMIKSILLNLSPLDFCYSTPNQNTRYPYGELYVFCPTLKFISEYCESEVLVYIKLSLVESPEMVVIVISFHDTKIAEKYLFK
jgi:hypothetical protein